MDTLNHGQPHLTSASPELANDQASTRSRIVGSMLALALGISIISAVGFLEGPSAAVHNAAHDTRHAFAFPCH